MKHVREIAVGDIHGRVDALNALLDIIKPREHDLLIFLGDYIDRGPYSAEVLDLLMKLDEERGKKDIFIMGNHEEMFLRWAGILESEGFADAWLHVGGNEVLRQWKGSVPRRVLEWMSQRLVVKYETEHAFYVHGGFRASEDFFVSTTDDECRWLRTEFVRSNYRYPKPVIVGHTTVDRVPGGDPYKGPVFNWERNVIFMDCAAFLTGVLCAYDVINRQTFIAKVGQFGKFK